MSGTREKIINSSIELFSSKPFEKVSIVEISKNADVSNGIVYQYFKNKNEIYTFLLSEIIIKISVYLNDIQGLSVEERLRDFIKKNLSLTKKEFSLIRIYRDGQYKFPEYEKKLKKVYHNALEKVYKRKLKNIEKFYILSIIRHINIYYTIKDVEPDMNFLVQSLMYGFLYRTKNMDLSIFHKKMFYLRIPVNSLNVKYKILNAGISLLKNQDIYSIKVKDIAGKAGISTGAFYSYFKSREIFFNYVILNIRRQILFFLKDNYNVNSTPLDNHILFLYLYFEYYKDSYFKYRVIRDMELINSSIYEAFIDKDIEFYVETLPEVKHKLKTKELISVMLLGIAHYMGIEFFYTMQFKDINLFLEEIKYFIQNGVEK